MLYMVHASFTHGVYTYGKVPKRFKSPPDWMADCKARARRWCGCTSAGVDPPGQGSVPTANTWSKPTNSGEGNAKALSILPLRMCKNIPAEALPACENDQNYYVLTARSQFLHSKPIKKKVRLLWEWQPFHHFSLKKGNRNFFSHWRS